MIKLIGFFRFSIQQHSTLKSQKDRTFGAAVVDGSSEMLFMNSEVVMKVEIDLDKVNDYDPK